MLRKPKSRYALAFLTGVALCFTPYIGPTTGMAAPKVGVTAAVNLDATGTPPGSATRVLALGQNVVFNERIATDGAGLVQVLLVDGTTFTVGPNSELTIDEFVYDPNSSDAKVVATIAKGAFRFIGGQTSRKEGGATVNTPAGSIGIRGAMVEGNVEGRSGTFSMIFGDEVVFTGINGDGERLFEPGFTLQVSGGGGNTQIRPRTAADAKTFQTALAGRPGQSGGSNQQPTNSGVANSQVANTNSNAFSGNVPVPTARPVQASTLDEVSESITDINQASQEEIRNEIEQNLPVIVTVPQTLLGRVLLAPAFLDHAFRTEHLNNPGDRGLVGTTPETDFNVTLTKQNGQLVFSSLTGAGGSIPDLTGMQGDTGLQGFQVSGTSPFGPISGPAYAGRNDFAAYFLGINGDPTQPLYIITGTETDFDTLAGQSSDIRSYSLTSDPLQNVTVPFFNPHFYGSLDNTNQTDLIIVERAPNSFKSFLTWTDISGTGSNQRSATYVTSGGGANAIDGNTQLITVRRGSFRGAANAPLFNMRGSSATSIAGPSGNHAFGPNAENFVVGIRNDQGDSFYDSPSDFCFAYCGFQLNSYPEDGNFGTHHVADLVSEIPKTNFSRTTRSHIGFMAGMAESEVEGYQNPYVVAAGTAPNFYLNLSAPLSQMNAVGTVMDINNASPIVQSLGLAFGPTADEFGPNAFVDDQRFGATNNFNLENTRLTTDGGENVGQNGFGAGSYIVSGRAAPISGYEHCKKCTFADWGWWGTLVTAKIDNAGNPQRRDEYVHMGTWVAGDITNPADLPLGPTNVVFDGTSLASVAQPSGSQYIAAGGFTMSMDLSNRSGNLAITNLDGANYAAAVTDASTATQALFVSNSLVGTNGLNGAVAGALVDNGSIVAAGAIGQFHASGSGTQVIGTFMGGR